MVMLGPDKPAHLPPPPEIPKAVRELYTGLRESMTKYPSAISSARLVVTAFDPIAGMLGQNEQNTPMPTPFGRRVRPALFRNACRHIEPLVDRLHLELENRDEKTWRSDIRKQLMKTDGRLTPDNLAAILKAGPRSDSHTQVHEDLYVSLAETLPDFFQPGSGTNSDSPNDATIVHWYREWNAGTSDYLEKHVRVVEQTPPVHAEDMFDAVLSDYRGMVLTLRRAFELLKPQGLTLLRRWPDGDDIDLSALITAAVDRRAGQTPSDRMYLKRAKQARDVAVLLLVDLSGSTKNIVPDTEKTVLSVEKEAIVLFREALRVVGDDFAVAGFSGRGRLHVDYYRYKDFEEPVTRSVRRRISTMTPQRSTRTGAALRHATTVLSERPSKVRLLILLSDGYPNDTGYKKNHAVADVQKAIAEARSEGIHVRPITINLTAEKLLDTLYGSLHHNIISDVRQLPDILWRIYCALTR
jgi:Mg-chelatase subunit ChlD